MATGIIGFASHLVGGCLLKGWLPLRRLSSNTKLSSPVPMSLHAHPEILTGSRSWSATPEDYSSLRFLQFREDGRGEALYGYGQTIYAKVLFKFNLLPNSVLHLDYLSSPSFARFQGFEPNVDTAEKFISYTLIQREYRGIESIIAQPFVCGWLLKLADSPWPVNLTFPHEVPVDFYGYRRDEPRG